MGFNSGIHIWLFRSNLFKTFLHIWVFFKDPVDFIIKKYFNFISYVVIEFQVGVLILQ